MSTKIIIAIHKPYWVPEDPVYLPLHVGREGKPAIGFAGERLLDVWLEHNKIPYKEQNVSFLEKQNWLVKGGLFLKRKFWGR